MLKENRYNEFIPFIFICISLVCKIEGSLDSSSHYSNLMGSEGIQQDIIVDNIVLRKSPHDLSCEHRYKIICTLLDQYRRPFTMLDIGAAQGYFSLKAAKDYDAVCVMIEANSPPLYPFAGDQLLQICRANKTLKNIIFLNKLFTANELNHLSQCEHFDVILALNILHEFGVEWQDVLNAILQLGDHIIIEIPSPSVALPKEQIQLRESIENYIFEKGGTILGPLPCTDQNISSVMYNIKGNNHYLQRKTWLRSIMKEKQYRIESSFTDKWLIKPKSDSMSSTQAIQWLPGINLCTFKMCSGVYPTKEMLKAHLQFLKDAPHTDWMINNMIVQGDNLTLIDCDDESCKIFFSQELFQAHQEIIDIYDQQKIEHFFWHKLIKIPVQRRQVIKFFGQLFPPCALIFDVCSRDETLIDKYLGYGAKVIYFDTSTYYLDKLYKSFKKESFFAAEKNLLSFTQSNLEILNETISVYGVPHFCNIHLDMNSTYILLKSLSQQIPSIAFRFSVQHKAALTACLERLIFLGYSKFNFSIRDLLGFILDTNKYTGQHKEWAHSAEDLLNAISAFAQLDADGENVWGYIYAQCEK